MQVVRKSFPAAPSWKLTEVIIVANNESSKSNATKQPQLFNTNVWVIG